MSAADQNSKEMAEKEQQEVEEESLQQKHRRERKELQASVMALKKSATKGDKKKKKEVMEQVAKMEAELDQRHKEELEAEEVNDKNEDSNEAELVQQMSNKATLDEGSTRVSKAQRRRDKKEAKEKEREAAIAAEAILNESGSRQMEMKTIAELLRSRNLKPLLIPSDGDCLYASLANECSSKLGKDLDVAMLRRMAADEMRNNASAYAPFIDEGLDQHCEKVEKSKEWGGQLEIRALSQALKAVVEVVQAEGPVVLFEPDQVEEKAHFVIAYYRHMYGLGEHYNGTQPL